MFARILVPLDGSPFSEAALLAAGALAEKSGAELRLVSVLETPPIFAYPEFRSEDRERAEAYVSEVRERVQKEMGVDPVTAVREGHVTPEVLKDAAEWNADLVVMASHGRGGISRLWLGSIADRCIRKAECPVLLIRSPDEQDQPPSPFTVRRVAVPLDGSELAEGALPAAADLARLYGAGIDLMRVVSYVATSDLAPTTAAVETDHQLLEIQMNEAEAYLSRVSDELKEGEIQISRKVINSLRPGHSIVENAGNGVIVMTTRGLGGLQRWILGSVTDRVIRGAEGPVLVIPGEIAASARAASARP